jgi:flagellar hook-associated protein 3 FlgL
MQVSTKIFNKQSVETFTDLTGQIQKKQEQIASGKELTKPSDDPVKAARVMVVKEQQAQNTQYLRNIDISYVKLSLTENALEQAASLATRAYELGVQARSATNAGGRSALAVEIKGIVDSIRDLANGTDASGRSIFGGFQVGSAPFTVDNAGNTNFVGDRGLHLVRISPSMELRTAVDGSTAFERIPSEAGGFNSIFSMLDSMVTDLEAGDAADLPIDDLKNAISHFADQRAIVGAQMNKADNQRAVLENRNLILTENIGEMEDADLSKIVTDLQNLLVNKEVAQKAFSMISQLNLFDMIA